MAAYCVNKNAQAGGEHEVHNLETCTVLPDPANRDALGDFSNCHAAVQAAKNRGYATADGCAICSPECHTR